MSRGEGRCCSHRLIWWPARAWGFGRVRIRAEFSLLGCLRDKMGPLGSAMALNSHFDHRQHQTRCMAGLPSQAWALILKSAPEPSQLILPFSQQFSTCSLKHNLALMKAPQLCVNTHFDPSQSCLIENFSHFKCKKRHEFAHMRIICSQCFSDW